jgi:hypothetical protein
MAKKTLDDEITQYEDAAAKRLHTLKATPFGSTVDSETAAELVVHLTIRNAHLRSTFTMGAKRIFGRAVDAFCDETALRPILGIDSHSPSETLKERIDQHLRENPAFGALGLPAHALHKIAHMMFKERFKIFFAEQAPFISAVLGELIAGAPAFVRKAHNEVLSSGLAPAARTERLRRFHGKSCPPNAKVTSCLTALHWLRTMRAV